MKRLLTLAAVAAMSAGLSAPSFAATMAHPSMMKPMTCPAGKHLVKAYTTKKGTKVAAHCSK